ncbi:MAG TPA: hypothetical protein PKN48_09640 [Bacteroidales bacterium]|nr:hypothetical protein [Bacteroidales bacterium]
MQNMEKKIQNTKNYRINYAMENPLNPDETDWYEKDSFLSSLTEYDQNGNTLKTLSYNHAGEIIEHYVYKYDEKNNLIEEINFFDENEIAEHRFFQYNESGKPVEEKIVYLEGGENFIKFFYDEKGNLTKRVQSDVDGEIEETEILEFMDGKLLRAVLTDGENNEMSRREYTYNDDGKMISYTFTSADPDSNFRTEYFYDENGSREKTLRYNSNNQLIEKNLFTTDENDNVTELYEEDPRSAKTTKFTFDENNNIVKQEEFNTNDELLSSIERTFDEEGRLTESLVFLQDPTQNIRQMYASKYEYEFFE